MPRPSFLKRKVYVHPIQRRYLYLSLLPLIICSLAIIVVTFLPMKLLLMGRAPEFDKVIAESCLAILGERLWPAIFISMLLVAGLSVLASHALGGPLYRLEAIGRRLADGDIPESVRVRQGDDLEGMASVLDRVVGNLRETVTRIRERAASARTQLVDLRRGLEAGSVPAADLSARLQEVAAQLDGIEKTLRTFRLEETGQEGAR